MPRQAVSCTRVTIGRGRGTTVRIRSVPVLNAVAVVTKDSELSVIASDGRALLSTGPLGGIAADVCVRGSRIVLMTNGEGCRGTLHVLDMGSDRERIALPVPYNGSAVVLDGDAVHAYLGTSTGVLYRVDLSNCDDQDGTSERSSVVAKIGSGITSLAVCKGAIYVGTDGAVFVVTDDGRVRVLEEGIYHALITADESQGRIALCCASGKIVTRTVNCEARDVVHVPRRPISAQYINPDTIAIGTIDGIVYFLVHGSIHSHLDCTARTVSLAITSEHSIFFSTLEGTLIVIGDLVNAF
ncbi:Uncharacterized protein PBTT_06009 [Plasmodiophora brassicae]